MNPHPLAALTEPDPTWCQVRRNALGDLVWWHCCPPGQRRCACGAVQEADAGRVCTPGDADTVNGI